MSNVKTDYVDYALKPVGSGNPVSLRKFETYNATTGALENTIYVKDVTDYATVGSNMLASDLNTIGNAVNSNSRNFASEYSPSATYIVGAYCTYQYVLYKCITAITKPEAWNSAHWTHVPVMDETAKSGTNANGDWIRYPDGIQICFKVVNITLASSTTWNAQYSYVIDMGSFPVEFASHIPAVTVTNGGGGNASPGYIILVANTTTSKAGFVSIVRPDNGTYTFNINMIAIGRWF